jgi:hypothetical protein
VAAKVTASVRRRDRIDRLPNLKVIFLCRDGVAAALYFSIQSGKGCCSAVVVPLAASNSPSLAAESVVALEQAAHQKHLVWNAADAVRVAITEQQLSGLELVS